MRTAAAPRMAHEEEGLLTLAEVEAAAKRVGCAVTVRATGPAYRVEVCSDAFAGLPSPRVQTLGYNDDAPPPPELLGYSTGFTQPTGVVHLETIETRKFTGFWSRKSERGAARYAAASRVNPGLLVGSAVVCWCRENGPFGCKAAQLLCIRDDERQHRSLVRYYRRLGFEVLREVGGDLRSVADRVVWGGDGTIMELDFDTYLRRLGGAVRLLGSESQLQGE